MNPSLRSPVDPLACPECGRLATNAREAWLCCSPYDESGAEVYEWLVEPLDVEDEMSEQERDELLAGGSYTPEEWYTDAVAKFIEARRAVQEEELRRAEIELVAIEELMHGAQARGKTEAKEQKTLHPGYRAHKERLNALELAVIRAEALVEVRKAQMWREVYAGITD